MKNSLTNKERTEEYLKKFDREKVLKFLVKDNSPVIFDVGANIGATLVEFKQWWPNAKVHCFEPQEECWRRLQNKIEDHNYRNVFVNKFAVRQWIAILDHP